ncbi:MAG: DUF4381 domain-containing protein [Gammaproteobacteria bacterium]
MPPASPMPPHSPAPTLPLRDIILPARIDWWPPAIGWWLLLALVIAALALSIWLWRRHRRRQRIIKPARQQLQQIERRFSRHGDSRQLLQELSTLLRRVALSRAPRNQVAGLTGQEWLRWLDQGLPDQPFSSGPGKVLADQVYRAEVAIDADSLVKLCERWLVTRPPKAR